NDAAHACCTNETETSISSDQMQCCTAIAAGFSERGHLQNCACMAPSRPATLGQNPFFAPDFIDSSSCFHFAHQEANVPFRDVAIKPLWLSINDSSSRAPPHFFSL